MAATLRQLNAPLTELLQVAERGDVDELVRLLPRVSDINARNRHGVTALMKAAFLGNEPMVRALLDHGADPNLMRNDKFTALALAAFSGHAETVKTLIEYGAQTEVVTRAGASAQTWAKARTFAEIARCLEAHAPKPVRAAPTPVRQLPTPVAVTPVEVKTLNHPPEIWDLVQEAPRNFNPRSAFISRVRSMKRTLAWGACALVLLIVGGGVGAVMLRNSQTSVLPAQIPPASITTESSVSTPAPAEVVVESPPVEVVNDNHANPVPNKARLAIREPRTVSVVTKAPVEKIEKSEAPAVASPKFESAKPAPPTMKPGPNNGLSPNLLTPSKKAPEKGKVIQWP